MLGDARAMATLPTSDIDEARRFYAEMLDLYPAAVTPQGLIYECGGGTRFLVFPSGGAPSGTHTQLVFYVNDIHAEVGDLRANGVKFEEYDLPGLQTVHGVATANGIQSAWFKDRDGNLLSLVQVGEAEPSFEAE